MFTNTTTFIDRANNMNLMCERLKKDIINAARGVLDPYKNCFRPKDLKLKSSNYGSFSDHCGKGETISSKWCGCGLLKRTNKFSPYKYILVK